MKWDRMRLHRTFKNAFSRRAGAACRFLLARGGTAAIEFAFVAPAFLALLIAIFQVMIFLFSQAVLQQAATSAGRLIMTGQAQNSGLTQAQFQSDVCPMVSALFNCSNVMVNVQTYASYSSAGTSTPTLTYNAQGQVTNSWSYNPGTPGDVVVVQLIYQLPVVSGPLGFSLANLGNGKAEIMGVTAFRVEPYQ
jgi:Flp pilus assembly protein TadG